MKKLTILVLVLFIGTAMYAQSEDPTPKKHDATWHQVVLISFKAGKVEEAKKLISKFASATENANTSKPQLFWFATGSYDMMLIWNMKSGSSDMEWSWSPDGVKWWKAFVAQEGSEVAANKVQTDYSALIASTTSQILRKDK